ncbi:MAG: hypothetical protein HFH04_10820 [Dorea sp.]|nr:hypothetical protein [Dorea sp.]
MNDKKRVTIRYQYYQLCTFEDDNYTENLYDLVEWLGRVGGLDLEEKVHEVSGIEGRLEAALPVGNDEFYALNFMRLDILSNTYILEKDTEARHVDLGENEYIGRNTVILYDPRYSIAMVQCNRGSYGVSSLQSYINSFNEGMELCYFRPIIDEMTQEYLEKAHTLKFDVRFANTRQFRTENSRFFNNVIDACNEIECYTAHIECGLGYNRGCELEKETVSEMVRELRNPQNRDAISSAKITLSDDQKSSVFELFNNIYSDKINFTVPARGELAFSDMTDYMIDKYDVKGSRAKIYSILRE